jgi:hypothetical protein
MQSSPGALWPACSSFCTGAHGNGFNPGGRGPSDAIAFPNLFEVFGSQANAMVQKIQSSISTWASSQAASGLSASALQQIFSVQANLIINNKGCVAQDCFIPSSIDCSLLQLLLRSCFLTRVTLSGVLLNNSLSRCANSHIRHSDLGVIMWNLLPFSRGSVQITVSPIPSKGSLLRNPINHKQSSNPFTKPKITVNYFSVDFDLQVQVASARLTRRILTTPPMR